MLTKTSTFLLLLISGLAVGQDIIRTQTTVVLVPALVKDSKGNTMAGLQAEDFVIEDNGAPQEVKLDETPRL